MFVDLSIFILKLYFLTNQLRLLFHNVIRFQSHLRHVRQYFQETYDTRKFIISVFDREHFLSK